MLKVITKKSCVKNKWFIELVGVMETKQVAASFVLSFIILFFQCMSWALYDCRGVPGVKVQ
jgi:hypothetical protein